MKKLTELNIQIDIFFHINLNIDQIKVSRELLLFGIPFLKSHCPFQNSKTDFFKEEIKYPTPYNTFLFTSLNDPSRNYFLFYHFSQFKIF